MGENLTTYTEEDPSGNIAVTPDTLTLANLLSSVDSWVIDDKGVDFFGESTAFEQLFDFDLTGTGHCFFGALANNVDTLQGLFAAGNLDYWGVRYSDNNKIFLFEIDNGSISSDNFTGITGTHYWFKFSYDPLVGTYGQIKLKIYTDAARTVLVSTLFKNVSGSVKSFRYNYALQSDGLNTDTLNGTFGGYDLQLVGGTALLRRQGLSEGHRILGTPTGGQGLIVQSNNRRFMGEVAPGVGIISGSNKK